MSLEKKEYFDLITKIDVERIADESYSTAIEMIIALSDKIKNLEERIKKLEEK